MATSRNAILKMESSRALTDYAVMTDSGDNKTYTVSGGTLWSNYEGSKPTVRPNGVSSGYNLLSAHTSDDTVSYSAFSAYLGGTEYDVTAGTVSISTVRPDTDVAKVISLVLDSDGSTVTAVEGTDGTGTAFSETRDAAGGPPLIGVDQIELGQIRVTSSTAAAVADSEIYQVPGTHMERYDDILWTVNTTGDGSLADTSAQENAYVQFDAAYPESHTGPTTRKVYIQYYTPSLSNIGRTIDFSPPETSYSSSSEDYYGGAISSVSESLKAGGFTALLGDGIGDLLVREKGKTLTFKFYPNRNESSYLLFQGVLGLAREFPKTEQNKASCTVVSETAAVEVSG